MQTCWVDIAERAYPIYIGQQLLTQKDLLTPYLSSQQVMIVTNQTIAPLYLAQLKSALCATQVDEVILPDGEQYKTIATWNSILDALVKKQHHRNTTIIALGGGVIGDMAGFAAACYQRGVPFIQVPTTLLAQVDASVGGKTAVNHPQSKNMIGAFYQPQAVLIDIDTLDTLAEREFRAGLAEVIKHALIRDVNFYQWLERNIEKVIAKEPEALQTIIHRCCEIKAEVVAQDEREQGLRAILNFGHTFGHSFENALGYGRWLHGEAVAAGMVIAAYLSCELGHISSQELSNMVALLQHCQLPTQVPQDLTLKQCMTAMKLDKKMMSQQLRLILLRAIGEAYITDDVPLALVKQALKQHGLSMEE